MPAGTSLDLAAMLVFAELARAVGLRSIPLRGLHPAVPGSVPSQGQSVHGSALSLRAPMRTITGRAHGDAREPRRRKR
jgi:hypothetical protein